MMNAIETPYVLCRNGVFTLPDAIFRSLGALVHNGFVYLRQDDDALTISTIRIADGYRRALNTRFRAPMFNRSTRLAIVDLNECIRVMEVEAFTSRHREPDERSPASG